MTPNLNSTPGQWADSVTLRFAGARDAGGLARLAALDSSGPLPPPVLLAEVGGEVHAALSLRDWAVVADPFLSTAELVELLRARAGQLDRALKPRRPRSQLDRALKPRRPRLRSGLRHSSSSAPG